MSAADSLRRPVALARRLREKLAVPPPPQWERLESEGVVEAGPGTYGMGHLWVHEYRAVDGRWIGSRLRIGAYCSLAPCEVFLNGNHRLDWVTQYPFRTVARQPGSDEEQGTRGDVVIGSDVWIGNGAVILSGVRIGHGAVVGAHAVVARDVRPYEVVVGNPARAVHRRFDDVTVERLLSLAWWEWPAERIEAELPTLCAPPAPPADLS